MSLRLCARSTSPFIPLTGNDANSSSGRGRTTPTKWIWQFPWPGSTWTTTRKTESGKSRVLRPRGMNSPTNAVLIRDFPILPSLSTSGWLVNRGINYFKVIIMIILQLVTSTIDVYIMNNFCIDINSLQTPTIHQKISEIKIARKAFACFKSIFHSWLHKVVNFPLVINFPLLAAFTFQETAYVCLIK